MTASPILLSLLLACAQPSDRELYLQSATEPPTQAHQTCARLVSPSLRGECQALSAYRAAQEGSIHEATGLCEAMEPGTWQEECWFMVADGAELHEEAIPLCKRAGTLKGRCLHHAFTRHSATLDTSQGREALLEALGALSVRYGGDPQRQEALLEQRASELLGP